MQRGLYILLALALIPSLLAEPAAKEKEKVPPDEKKVGALVKQLGAGNFKARKEADLALRALQAPVLPLLAKHLKSAKDPEIRIRLKDIVRDLSTPRITLEQLEAIVVDEINLDNVQVKDALAMLEKICNNQFKTEVKLKGQQPPLITFRAREITALEALRIITQIANLRYTLDDGVIVVTPKFPNGIPAEHQIEIIDDPFGGF